MNGGRSLSEYALAVERAGRRVIQGRPGYYLVASGYFLQAADRWRGTHSVRPAEKGSMGGDTFFVSKL